jgi:murein DD-endopeptidase MepM/ murein hydrolase activator NlpD
MRLGFVRKWWWIVPVVVLDIWLVLWWMGGRKEGGEDAGGWGCACRRQPPEVAPEPEAPRVIPPLVVTFPTAQTNLTLTNDATVFMPTASGRVESALYGSTRTRVSTGGMTASFHEGVDIAPLTRDRRGLALDAVRAIADGTVAYASRVAGNSSYGRYVVIEHEDPVGTVYSLYSHLSSVQDGVRDGLRVNRGDPVGVMGNSSTLGIPAARGHLHLEIGLILSRQFDAWCRARKIDNPHGIYHGWNLTGIDPLALYAGTEKERVFRMGDYLDCLPVAFEVAIVAARPIPYFSDYAPLWRGEGPASGALVLAVSHGGVISAGRPATEAERAQMGGNASFVLSVDREALDRNGPRLVIERGGTWELSDRGRQWIEMLTQG